MSDDVERRVVERAAELIRNGMDVVASVRKAINESPARGLERLSLVRASDRLSKEAAGLASGHEPG